MELPERFRKVRILGMGGAGRTLLVRDKSTSEHVALKFLSVGPEDADLSGVFESEFRTLTRLDHPAVVKVHEFGRVGTQPYFTMDFVPGETCRSFVREDRLGQPDFLRLAAQLLRALDYLHLRGVVHRDVKPENVIVRRGEGGIDPVLIDFGMAVEASGAGAGRAAGTLPYVAPEILQGERARPTTDLFALGMMLFEIATGRHVASAGEILRDPGSALAGSRVRDEYRKHARGAAPRRFADLIAGLVAPLPRSRLPSAAEALRLLARLFGDEWGVEDGDRPTAPTSVELGDPPLSGRSAVVAAFMGRVQQLADAQLTEPLLIVAAPPGGGVTRVLTAMRNEAALTGTEAVLGASLQDLAKRVEHLPGVEGRCIGGDAAETVFRIDYALEQRPSSHRAVLLLDNVHAATADETEALRSWVLALERRNHPRQLLVLGGQNDATTDGAELLRTAGRAVPSELRSLSPLGVPEVRAVLCAMAGLDRVPGEAVRMLERATAGSPRLLLGLIRILVREGVLDLSGSTPRFDEDRLGGVKLPTGIEEAVQRRMAGLDAGVRGSLARLALAGSSLRLAAAAAIAEGHIAELEREGFLLRDGGRLRFESELTRRSADVLEGAELREAWAEIASRVEDTEPVLAATFHARAGQLEDARRVGIPAAEELLSERRLDVAIELLRDLLGDPPDPDLAFKLADALFDRGRYKESVAVAEGSASAAGGSRALFQLAQGESALKRHDRALQALKRIDGEDVRVLFAKSSILRAQGDHESALAVLDEVMEQDLTAPQQVAADSARATSLWRLGRFRAAERLIRGYLPAADADRKAAGLLALATMRQTIDPEPATLRLLAAVRRVARTRARPALRVDVELSIASLLIEVGRHRSAARLLAGAEKRLGRLGDGQSLAEAVVIRSVAEARRGDSLRADALLARAARMPGVTGLASQMRQAGLVLAGLAGREFQEPELPGTDRYVRMETALALAEAAAVRSDLPEAERLWRDALRVAWEARYARRVLDIRVGLAECAAARGTWNLAERHLGRRDYPRLRWRTPATARAALVRAGAALYRKEPALAVRLIQHALDAANHCPDGPTRAYVYTRVADLVQETGLRRWLRRNTNGIARELLEVARSIWLEYGNNAMLRKLDLQLAELPEGSAGTGFDGAIADKLVRILHFTREMNEEFDRDRLLRLILDRAVELTQAERGFVVLLKEGKEEVQVARNFDREGVADPETKVSTTIISMVLKTGRIVRAGNAEEDERFADFLSVHDLRLRSLCAVPLRQKGKTIGLLYLDNRHKIGLFSQDAERALELFADQAVAAIDKARIVRELRERRAELEQRDKVQVTELRQQQRAVSRHRRAQGWGFDKIVTREPQVENLVREAKRAAKTAIPVLLLGERGTGKELFARAIHAASPRRDMPFVPVDCAAYDADVLERELFGHVRAGDEPDRLGFLEEADGGSIYFASVESLPRNLQARAVDAVERGEVRRLGGSVPHALDVRLIGASHGDVDEFLRAGRLRRDFIDHLAQFALHLPSLRERRQDVEPLARQFVKEIGQAEGRPELSIDNDAIGRLEGHTWPGNLRELRRILQRAAMDCESETILASDVRFDTRARTVLPSLDHMHVQRVRDEIADRGIDLNARQVTAMGWLLSDGKLLFGDYRNRFQVSKSTAARDLEHLTRSGLLDKRGRTRAVVYTPGPVLREVVARVVR